MDKYVVLHIEGGIGKNVIATAVIRAIQKKYKNRKIIVLTAYPECHMILIEKVIIFTEKNIFLKSGVICMVLNGMENNQNFTLHN